MTIKGVSHFWSDSLLDQIMCALQYMPVSYKDKFLSVLDVHTLIDK